MWNFFIFEEDPNNHKLPRGRHMRLLKTLVLVLLNEVVQQSQSLLSQHHKKESHFENLNSLCKSSVHLMESETARYWIYLPVVYRSSPRRCSIKKDVLKNFIKFTGKHLCIGVFLCILRNFEEHLFYRTPLVDCFCV